jgi:hypothetical protein
MAASTSGARGVVAAWSAYIIWLILQLLKFRISVELYQQKTMTRRNRIKPCDDTISVRHSAYRNGSIFVFLRQKTSHTLFATI